MPRLAKQAAGADVGTRVGVHMPGAYMVGSLTVGLTRSGKWPEES